MYLDAGDDRPLGFLINKVDLVEQDDVRECNLLYTLHQSLVISRLHQSHVEPKLQQSICDARQAVEKPRWTCLHLRVQLSMWNVEIFGGLAPMTTL